MTVHAVKKLPVAVGIRRAQTAVEGFQICACDFALGYYGYASQCCIDRPMKGHPERLQTRAGKRQREIEIVLGDCR